MVDNQLRALLEEFAKTGHYNGFSLRIYDYQVSGLEEEGIHCSNPIPMRRSGENRYDIDFSKPVPGKLSEHLYNIAIEARYK